MKKYLLFSLLFLSLSGFAQSSINNYKYVIVPEKFSFLKQKDQYMLNSNAKAMLEQKGFEVYFNNTELPSEISNNRCTALELDILSKNKLFSTNLTIILKDCKGNVVFKSEEGNSREKEFDLAYNTALQDAFTSLNSTPYAYSGPATVNAQQTSSVSAAQNPALATPAPVTSVATVEGNAITLYAQPTDFGFQLIDTAPKIVLTLYKTTVENYFIADNESSHGIVFKKNENWTFEYYKNGKLVTEKLFIKF